MPLTVAYDPDIDCIRAVFEGELDRELISEFFSAAGKLARENTCNRILSDTRNATITASETEMFSEAESLSDELISFDCRRAIVIPSNVIPSKDTKYQFWENLCVNRGHYNVKLFQDYDEALNWLLQS